jgi:uncharacterized protein
LDLHAGGEHMIPSGRQVFLLLAGLALLLSTVGATQAATKSNAARAAVTDELIKGTVTQLQLQAELLRAAQRGDAQAVKRLLTAGASPDAHDDRGRTALTMAAIGDHVAAAELLVAAGANPDPQDDQRNNALLVTGETGSVAMLRVVLRARPELTRTNRFGGTALIPAADRGHLAYVQELLKTTKVDVNHINHLGWTALLEAVILGDGGPAHTEIVRALLAHGADRTLADRAGVTALAHARQRGYTQMVRLLTPR